MAGKEMVCNTLSFTGKCVKYPCNNCLRLCSVCF